MPTWAADGSTINDYVSTDGGATYTRLMFVSAISAHGNSGGLRTEPLPSAEIVGSGKVYVVWQDCSFRTNCASNDIVMSTSTDGITWTPKTRIPIDPVTSTVDHVIPGIAVDPSTSGTSTPLALTYYYYPNASCTMSTCQLDVGEVTSADGAALWSAPQQLAGPMNLAWLPQTSQGNMVGDYISTSFLNGIAMPVFAVANPPSSGVLDQGMYSTAYAVGGTTLAHVSRLSIRVQHDRTLLRWYSSVRGRGFNVFDGSRQLNRHPITSATHWYRFSNHGRVHHLHILPIHA